MEGNEKELEGILKILKESNTDLLDSEVKENQTYDGNIKLPENIGYFVNTDFDGIQWLVSWPQKKSSNEDK
jgi:hypothetical protein